MNPQIRRATILFAAAALAVLAFPACSTLRPIASKPPVAKIILDAPYSTYGVITQVALPAGEYRPAYEDHDYYYYQAPSKIVISRMHTRMRDGGIYVTRDTASMVGCYYVDEDGTPVYRKFSGEPPHQTVSWAQARNSHPAR